MRDLSTRCLHPHPDSRLIELSSILRDWDDCSTRELLTILYEQGITGKWAAMLKEIAPQRKARRSPCGPGTTSRPPTLRFQARCSGRSRSSVDEADRSKPHCGRYARTRRICRVVGAVTFHTSRMEHSPTSATGTSWERTPWHAIQRAAWELDRRYCLCVSVMPAAFAASSYFAVDSACFPAWCSAQASAASAFALAALGS